MGAGEPNLPVQDESIETIEEWQNAIGEFLGEDMYAIRLLCEIDLYSGTRFVDLKEALPGSSSTLTMRKNRAVELYLIEPELKNADKGYGTHKYYQLTKIGEYVREELNKRGVTRIHRKLKPLEQQLDNQKSPVRRWAEAELCDRLESFHEEYRK